MLRSHFLEAVLAAAAVPPWLEPRPGRFAYAAEAPWPMDDRPEAALTFSLRSARPEPEDQTKRPSDAVGAPIGTKVRFAGMASAAVALLRVPGFRGIAYARLDRLVPLVPAGTKLVVAGGFGNDAPFYAAQDVPLDQAWSLPTGVHVTALGMGVAPYDPDGSDFVRIRVHVDSGARMGETGWIPAVFAGLSRPHARPGSTAERACGCRILDFRASP